MQCRQTDSRLDGTPELALYVPIGCIAKKRNQKRNVVVPCRVHEEKESWRREYKHFIWPKPVPDSSKLSWPLAMSKPNALFLFTVTSKERAVPILACFNPPKG